MQDFLARVPAYKHKTLKERAQFLYAIAANLDKTRAAIVRTACEETNLDEARLNGELKRTIFQLTILCRCLCGRHLA